MKKILYFFILCTSVSVAQKNLVRTNSVSCLPVASVCNPITQDSATAAGLGIGINYVELNQIQNASAGQSSALQDFTCTDSTELNINVPYLLTVTTGQTYEESVNVWIDFSNDGNFVPAELVYHDSAVIHNHTGTITIPQGTPNTFTLIRMRVGSEYSGNFGPNACDDLLYGQYEDYKIYYGVNVGIDAPENKIQVTLHPNPIHESAMLVISGNDRMQEMEMNIYNSFGQHIRTEFIAGTSTLKIDRGNLSGGLYFYSVKGKGEIIAAGKFIVE